jgi:hypothetical protein
MATIQPPPALPQVREPPQVQEPPPQAMAPEPIPERPQMLAPQPVQAPVEQEPLPPPAPLPAQAAPSRAPAPHPGPNQLPPGWQVGPEGIRQPGPMSYVPGKGGTDVTGSIPKRKYYSASNPQPSTIPLPRAQAGED